MFKAWVTLTLITILSVTSGCAERSSDYDRADRAGRPTEGRRQAPEKETVRVVVPEGTSFTIALDQRLSSRTNSPGDPVSAHVVGEIRGEGGLVARDGAKVSGVVAQVEGSDRIKGRAFLGLNFTSLETVTGSRSVQTTMVEGTLEAPGTKKRDAAIIAGGAAAGAVIGEILGDAKLGAIIGAAAGTGVVLATKGEEVEVEPGTQLTLKFVRPLELEVAIRGELGGAAQG